MAWPRPNRTSANANARFGRRQQPTTLFLNNHHHPLCPTPPATTLTNRRHHPPSSSTTDQPPPQHAIPPEQPDHATSASERAQQGPIRCDDDTPRRHDPAPPVRPSPTATAPLNHDRRHTTNDTRPHQCRPTTTHRRHVTRPAQGDDDVPRRLNSDDACRRHCSCR